jgi:signal transduction histidine kinase
LLPDQLAAVFDRFYRADKSRSRETGGTGLGLAIVKAIVESHGGRVQVASDGLGKGSLFSIYLPNQ